MKTLGLLGSVHLPGRTESVGVARAYVRLLLHVAASWDVDRVELLVSELVANAIQHSESGRRAGGLVELVLSETGHALRVDVIDEGSVNRIPQIPEQVDPLSEGGRGLWLVAQQSSAWGWAEDQAGRVVWFEVARS
ncbi:ATP-binding protein [Sphaerisporangium corydalis]|uniref:ATP-binding protein n=1 Tax=Sphaerisporangium corydalis TaxID=1441875 RepID=A0ABV9E5I3_9ACTN|nr:ATP-binding protein [Sphaerisporangium corydalis]